MMKLTTFPVRTINVKNMTCNCCIYVIRHELALDGIELHDIKLGTIILSHDTKKISMKKIESIIESFVFEIIINKEKVLVEHIKQAVIDLVHNSTYNAMVRNSDYLVERFGMSYSYISTLFSKHESKTLEKFTILHKIEKVKELIEYGELTLSEIAYMMGYSSVQYLSSQFKTITGISVTEYKVTPSHNRSGLDKLILGEIF
ncbi:MAG: helix-turn-helix domain-containing protein [Bacteroidetes bacterium]|nr:helix-turn-helix domain-containing protein [Bacteroidota bacterium]